MNDTSRKRAVQTYRARLAQRGVARFEVQGLEGDRELIRRLARKLADDGAEASRLRAELAHTLGGEPPRKGGVLDALRRSPLVGVDLDFTRPVEPGRKVDL